MLSVIKMLVSWGRCLIKQEKAYSIHYSKGKIITIGDNHPARIEHVAEKD